MAIGDAVAALLGTAQTARQPASGVEEQITSIIQNGNTDPSIVYDGTNNLQILDGGVNTHTASAVGTSASNRQTYNMALMINNSVYIRKNGTADRIYFGGVQTNA